MPHPQRASRASPAVELDWDEQVGPYPTVRQAWDRSFAAAAMGHGFNCDHVAWFKQHIPDQIQDVS